MAMAGRHIRHDYKQFVILPQKSVRTLCNKTSTFNATGIPGVTEQAEIVEAGDKKVFGWCTMCSVWAFREASAIYNNPEINMHHGLTLAYDEVIQVTRPVFEAWAARQRAASPVR